MASASRTRALSGVWRNAQHNLTDLAFLAFGMARQPHHLAGLIELLLDENCSGAEVAAKLQMKVATVYMAKYRVQKMLAEEVQRLQQSGPGER
jgi:DNA-binding CsgD family transcriptional regulator